MKKLMLLLALGSTPALSLERDKAMHLTVSTLNTLWLSAVYDKVFESKNPELYGFLTMMAIGVAKEVYDSTKPRNHYDHGDMAYNVMGASIGVGLFYVYKF
jgi:uncharacterized protein YfiM (DUF2279 family)